MTIPRNQLFIPTVAGFMDDIRTSLAIQQPLVERGYEQGLMIATRNGRKGVTLDSSVHNQYSNLRKIQREYGNSAVIVMLTNIPIEEIDFLHEPQYAAEHVKRGIDFSRGLPIGGRRILTFHLNSLVSPDEWNSKSEIQWKNTFYKEIAPVLGLISEYGKRRGVEVKVETVPVPEFGDLPSDEIKYKGVRLNQLRNPFYLTSRWGFEQVRDSGIGVCLDLSHSRTIYKMAELGDTERVLHDGDVELLESGSLFNDVLALQKEDLVHLNDGRGIFSDRRQMLHEEGITLGRGDIRDLKAIIKELDKSGIPYVLEINETDFKGRPNTKASIDYLLSTEAE